MIRRVCHAAVCIVLLCAAARPLAAEAPGAADNGSPAGYSRVIISPAKTSIYLGTVSMTMPAFVRVNEGFESAYTAKVFPFFFYNEAGRLRVEISDASLRQLERGEAVDFKGLAVREDGAERPVEGRATPADSASGKIKVRVSYAKRIELIFNTTYRFPDAKE